VKVLATPEENAGTIAGENPGSGRSQPKSGVSGNSRRRAKRKKKGDSSPREILQ